MKIKNLRHIPLFEHFSADQDEEDVKEVEDLPYFDLIVELALKSVAIPTVLTDDWGELERALTTCAYLGTDHVAKRLIAQALWDKARTALGNILDFETSTWKKNHAFLNRYLEVYFQIRKDQAGKIHAQTRVQHCWTDETMHDKPITIEDAAIYDNVKTLAHLREKGYAWDECTCRAATEMGNIQSLTYLHENGCPWDAYTCSMAARYGQLHCLVYAHEKGCPWAADACMLASAHGHITLLVYLHENGCPWNEFTCSWAAENGQLDCLRYAHENGCPWDAETAFGAAGNGHLHCLTYAHENGCPWDADTCDAAAEKGHMHCFKYAFNKGCPTRFEFVGFLSQERQ